MQSAHEFRSEMEKNGKYEEWAHRAVDLLMAYGFGDMKGRFSAKEASFVMLVAFQIICDYHEWLTRQLGNMPLGFVPPIQGDYEEEK